MSRGVGAGFVFLFLCGTLSWSDDSLITASNVEEIPLPRAVELTLANSHKIKRAKELVVASGAVIRTTRAAFLPKITAEVTAGTYHDRIPIPGNLIYPTVPRDRNSYIAQLKATTSLFAGFRDSSAHARASSAEQVAQADLRIAQEEVVNDVISLYFGIQLLLKNIDAEKEARALRTEQLEQVKHRLASGSAIELAGLQVEYALKAQLPLIASLEADLESRKLKLSRLIGFPLSQTFKLTSDLPDASAPFLKTQLPSFSEAFDFALKNNPNFAKYEAQLTQFQNETGEILAKHLPSLDLALNGGTNAYQRPDIGSNDSVIYGAELRLVVPLFSGLDSFSERAERQSRLNALKEARTEYRESFLDQLNDAYRKFELASTRWEADRVNLISTEKAANKARGFYRAGRATLADLLDADNRFLEARRNATQTKFDRVVGLFKIKSLLGLNLSEFENAL